MTIHRLDETRSTNLEARAGRPGEVWTAEYQTAGRGRLDHAWQSRKGENLMFSAVLDAAGRPPEEVATLPLVVGLAVLRALAAFTSAPLALKWPNDVLAGGRKICGILCERADDRVIAGVGVNVNQADFPPELAALHPEFASCDFLRGRTVAAFQTDSDGEPVTGPCGGIGRDGSLLVGGRCVFAGEAHLTAWD